MIFVSHYNGDKPFVARYAEALEAAFDRDNVFYDAWSIEPGDSIVEGIDTALGRCTHFFLFMTEESLKRPWVKAEWQAAFVRKVADATTLIPVRLDDCQPPPLLAALRGIDATDIGPDQAAKDVVKTVKGDSIYETTPEPRNISAAVTQSADRLEVEVSVAAYVWHNGGLAFLFDDPPADDDNERVGESLTVPSENGGFYGINVGEWNDVRDSTRRLAVFVDPKRPVTVTNPLTVAFEPLLGTLRRLHKVRPEPQEILYDLDSA